MGRVAADDAYAHSLAAKLGSCVEMLIILLHGEGMVAWSLDALCLTEEAYSVFALLIILFNCGGMHSAMVLRSLDALQLGLLKVLLVSHDARTLFA